MNCSPEEGRAEIDLSFVIPVRNDAFGLQRCLDSIRRATRDVATSEIIVVDNGSTDGSTEVARLNGCRLYVVPHERVGALRNMGASAARGRLVAFIDADHELSMEWVQAAIDAMRDPATSAVGAAYTPPSAGSWVQRTYDALRDHRLGRRSVSWLGSGNLVVRRDVFQRAGGFDVSLETCEDVDLCRRIRATHGLVINDERLHSIHYGDPSTLYSLFKSELWRGRDNLRVSLREPLTLRGLPSVIIPVVGLALLGFVTIASGLGRFGAAGGALTLFLALSAIRAWHMRRRGDVPLHHALAVALTYDAARALALVMRVRHRRAKIGRSLGGLASKS